MTNSVQKITVFAPASIANVNVGFDLLGFPNTSLGDQVTIEKIESPEVIIDSIEGGENLPLAPDKNTAGVPLLEILRNKKIEHGLKLKIKKGIPIGSGLGGSAASAVGAVVAANQLLNLSLRPEELLHYSLEGEKVASGHKHPDNVVPCLFGGICLTTSMYPFRIINLPIPNVTSISFYPHISIKTEEARSLLKKEVRLDLFTQQSAQLAGFISGLYQNDLDMIGQHFNDVVIEPQRSQLIKGFDEAKKKALEMGAIGFGISGSGPSLFCWAKNESDARKIETQINAILVKHHGKVDSWSGPISTQGAIVI